MPAALTLLPHLAQNVPAAALSAATALAYALVPWACPRLRAVQARALLALTWALHLGALVAGLSGDPVRFGFAPALSVTAWLVLTVYLIESRLYPRLQARWTLAILGAVVMVLALLFPGAEYPALASAWLPLHWALGIASYGLIAAAVVHAFLMQRAEHAMRQGDPGEAAMPLLALERLTFRFVTAGFVLLSLTLVAGWYFSELLNQRMVWNHKAVFSALAWVTMGVLLWGRWRLGWRGRVAVRTLYLGAGLLLLGYVGSHFVLEVLLQRT